MLAPVTPNKIVDGCWMITLPEPELAGFRPLGPGLSSLVAVTAAEVRWVQSPSVKVGLPETAKSFSEGPAGWPRQASNRMGWPAECWGMALEMKLSRAGSTQCLLRDQSRGLVSSGLANASWLATWLRIACALVPCINQSDASITTAISANAIKSKRISSSTCSYSLSFHTNQTWAEVQGSSIS